jgi:hypothetical protein
MAPQDLEPEDEARFFAGIQYVSEFFMGQANVQRAVEKLTRILEEEQIPYAIIGAMAMNEYGYVRATVDVDVLMTQDSLNAFKQRWVGRGYLEKFPGSRGLRDTENGVNVDVVIAGHYPGDGKPKAIAFPDPEVEAQRGARVRLLPLPRFLELKLASGMTAAHRMKDLTDVLELIRLRDLPRDFEAELDPSVRAKFAELWEAAQQQDPLTE